MIRKTKTRAYALLGLFAILFAGIPACAPSAGQQPTAGPSVNELIGATQTAVALLTPKVTATPTSTPTASAPASTSTTEATDTGWQGEYFTNDRFEGPAAFTRVDPEIKFDWLEDIPAAGMPKDEFSVRWTRCLDLEERYYIFTAQADDHVRVLVDDLQVMEGPWNLERAFAVSAGSHCIKVEYREGGGGAMVNFSFRPGDPFVTAHESIAWKGEYFANKGFMEPVMYTRNDPAPIFDWGEANPAPNVPVNDFTVRWTRCMDFEGRDYVFTAHADDYVRVLLDEVQVLEAPLYANIEETVAVTAGRHCVKVEYREDGGTASVFVDFK